MVEPGRCDAAYVDGLIGRRVVVRHRMGDKLTDAVGDLAADGADLVVHTRRGPVRVRRSAVTAVRAVPPPVPKRASLSAVARLEGLCADAWPALVDEPLGAWRLRAADGFTGRANAALAIGDPGMPVAAALDAVRAFAERHGIPPRVHVPMGSPWDRRVAEAGWVLDEGHAAGAVVSVQVAELDAVAERVGPPPKGLEWRGGAAGGAAGAPWDGDGRRPGTEWWRLVLGELPTAAQRHVLASQQAAGFLLLRDDDGGPLGAARGVVISDHLHVSQLTVAAGARRSGVGTALLAAAATWGRARGARWGVLQVAVHNTAALALYARAGWTEHHRYRYLVPPGTVQMP